MDYIDIYTYASINNNIFYNPAGYAIKIKPDQVNNKESVCGVIIANNNIIGGHGGVSVGYAGATGDTIHSQNIIINGNILRNKSHSVTDRGLLTNSTCTLIICEALYCPSLT